MIQRLAPAALVAAVMLPGAALADAALESSAPTAGETVAGPLTELALSFRNAIRLTRVEVEGPDGTIELDVAALEGSVFVAPADLGPGAYELSYVRLGRDGHQMKGAFGFEVE